MRMVEMRRLLFVGLAIGMLLQAASADNVIEPPWAGQEGSTYQEWTFDDDDNPALPEVIDNPYGGAQTAITVGQFGQGWLQQFPGMGTKTGYWDIGYGGQIIIDIDNRPDPLPYKEVWIQVTYFKDINDAPMVEVETGQYITGQSQVVEQVLTGGDWIVDQSVWLLEPNPPSERVTMTSHPLNGSVIDQIVIHTICIPEPTSLGLLCMGGLSLIRRRR